MWLRTSLNKEVVKEADELVDVMMVMVIEVDTVHWTANQKQKTNQAY